MAAPRIVVMDHGSGNLRSAERAIARAGADVTVTGDLAAAAGADGLVVPGVGAYATVMGGIDAIGARQTILDRIAGGRPVLGICVGMQVLFDQGEEHGVVTKGLGVLPGQVTRLAAERVPHMGWNTVAPPPGSRLFSGVPADARFYFVHSYAATPVAGQGLQTLTVHGAPFLAAVERGCVWATQFHPEKSGDLGAKLLRNWLATVE